MGKEKQSTSEVDDHYHDEVIGIDGGDLSSARIWERPRYRSGNFSRMFKPTRPLTVESSQRYLQEIHSSKSDDRKGGVELITDEARIHMPGDTSTAQIVINPRMLEGSSRFDIELTAQVHTYTIINTGQSSTTYTSKDVLFSETGSLQGEGSALGPTTRTRHFWLEQTEKGNTLKWTAQAIIPTGFVLQSSRLRSSQRRTFHAPSTYRDYNNRRSETSYVSYHWKVTRWITGTFKRNERHWKPIIVVASPPDVRRDPSLTAPLSYPPPPNFQRNIHFQVIKKNIFGTAGLIAVEIAMPDVTKAHPIFRPIPIVLRVSARAKTPSTLLELGGDFTLPDLPDNEGLGAGEKGKFSAHTDPPTFTIERETFSRAHGSRYEYSIAQQTCRVRWDTGHKNNGFRPGKGKEGFEDGREGATPRASELALQGRAHGWLWPSRDTENSTWYPNHASAGGTPTPIGSVFDDGKQPRSKVLTTDELQKFSYITSATLFGWVYPDIGPRIELPKLRVYYMLKFAWPFSGMRNKVSADLSEVGVTLSVHLDERHLITEEDLKHAVLSPSTFDPQGSFLAGVEPPPPPHRDTGRSGTSGGSAVHGASGGSLSSWAPSFAPLAYGDMEPFSQPVQQNGSSSTMPAPAYEANPSSPLANSGK